MKDVSTLRETGTSDTAVSPLTDASRLLCVVVSDELGVGDIFISEDLTTAPSYN